MAALVTILLLGSLAVGVSVLSQKRSHRPRFLEQWRQRFPSPLRVVLFVVPFCGTYLIVYLLTASGAVAIDNDGLVALLLGLLFVALVIVGVSLASRIRRLEDDST